MKLSKFALAAVLASVFYALPAWAEEITQPAPAEPGDYFQSSSASFNESLDEVVLGEGGCSSCESDCSCDYGCGWGSGLLCRDLGDPFDLGDRIFCEDSGWDLAGWTQWGYHSANDGVFNTHPGNLDLQQGYMYLEKEADGSCGIGLGGRVDVLYGTDASNTQSFGNHFGRFDYAASFNHGVYGWAIPQAYLEVAYEKLSVKVGHFYTLLGYQVVPATGNFFYSIPYTFNFGEAFTHTGALATYEVNENVTVYGGWTLGWDTGFDQLRGGNSFLGGASVKLTDDLTATYICTAGNLGWIGQGYTHSLVVDWVINDKWEYVFQSDLDSINNSPNATIAPGVYGHYDALGVNQYLFYTVCDNVRAGARMEWWKAEGISLCEMAYGINYRPHANVLFRPEVRYNWVPAGVVPGFLPVPPGPNQTAASDYINNTIFGVDCIITF